jgi:prolyl oligopeptidase
MKFLNFPSRRGVCMLATVLPLVAQPVLAQQCSQNAFALTYPVTPKVNQVDEYHGVKVDDPYRWLEDANSAGTQAWVSAQNQLTQGFLNQIPERAAIRQRLTQLWNFERFTVPFKAGIIFFSAITACKTSLCCTR